VLFVEPAVEIGWKKIRKNTEGGEGPEEGKFQLMANG